MRPSREPWLDFADSVIKVIFDLIWGAFRLMSRPVFRLLRVEETSCLGLIVSVILWFAFLYLLFWLFTGG